MVDYIPRGADGRPQKEAETIEYDRGACLRHAVGTIKRIKRAVLEFRQTGDPEAFPANPMSQLCTNKYCSARGTSFCDAWRR